ncbi:MAG: M20/M25/M40 family metallo-hydrolase [Terriglobales bacterium]
MLRPLLTALAGLGLAVLAQAPAPSPALNPNAACRPCIQAHENFLASDALLGRGSGTRDELIAATYIASELEVYGIQPAAEGGGYIEIAPATPRSRRGPAPPPIAPPLPPNAPQPSPQLGTTASVLGMLPGSDPNAPVLLLTAHLDHLGVIPARAYNGDDIFNGADDDASGCTAVLELARVLALGPRPRRSVYFAFFGSEETGGFGARYFTQHPPVPLDHFFANLEFEMIGWPDPKVPPDTLWLTGWERSNLGPHMAAQGARIVADPHPKEGFFCRSDNIQLAEAGVVAQTVSTFGLQPMYHRPDDDLAHLDVGLMTNSIGSMIAPVRDLLNSTFVPAWNTGMQPKPGFRCR